MTERRPLHISLLWPPQQLMVETLFRHYVELVEVASYLASSKISRSYPLSVEVHDCTVSTYSPARLATVAKHSDVIAICVNPYNVLDAIKTTSFLKSVNNYVHVVAYGSACCYAADQLATYNHFNYIISTGEYELGLEVALFLSGFINRSDLHQLLQNREDAFTLKDVTIQLMDGIRLDPSEWGLPIYQHFHVMDYLRVGDGVINLRVARGCPHKCNFCDEIYVGGAKFRYRPISQVIKFLTNFPAGAKVAYLNASAFTADRKWVLDLCTEIKRTNVVLPWRVCTRLDLVDQELVQQMAFAGCRRISFGIESLETKAQDWTGKTSTTHRIIEVAEWCKTVGIVPRALLILGLPNQTAEGIRVAHEFFKDLEIETRYRPLLKLDQFARATEGSPVLLDSSDRWSSTVQVDGMSPMEVRALEFNL